MSVACILWSIRGGNGSGRACPRTCPKGVGCVLASDHSSWSLSPRTTVGKCPELPRSSRSVNWTISSTALPTRLVKRARFVKSSISVFSEGFTSCNGGSSTRMPGSGENLGWLLLASCESPKSEAVKLPSAPAPSELNSRSVAWRAFTSSSSGSRDAGINPFRGTDRSTCPCNAGSSTADSRRRANSRFFADFDQSIFFREATRGANEDELVLVRVSLMEGVEWLQRCSCFARRFVFT